MQKERILEIIRHPHLMKSESDLPLFKELSEEFPYFSVPHILLTKHLSQQKSIYLEKHLKLSAIYIGNRKLLYDLIHKPEEIVENEIVTEKTSEEKTHISTGEKMLHAQKELTGNEVAVNASEEKIIETQIAETVVNEIPETQLTEVSPEENSHITEAEKMLQGESSEIKTPATNAHKVVTDDYDAEIDEEKAAEEKSTEKQKNIPLEILPVATYDYFAYQKKLAEKQAAENKAVEKQIEIKTEEKQELAFSEETTLTFTDWLNKFNGKNKPEITETIKPKTAETQNVAQPKKPARSAVDDIISKFITAEPKIKPKPASFFKAEEYAQKSAEEDNSLATETLANIYLKQGFNDKALEIFNVLITKYPQKSAYFAAKIQEIKNNQ